MSRLTIDITDHQHQSLKALAAAEGISSVEISGQRLMLHRNGNYILLDVRTTGEVSRGKIADSRHCDFLEDNFQTCISSLDKNKKMLVYCASGGRSEEAAEAMLTLGFKEVHNLEGGIDAWKKVGYPVVK